MIRLAVAAPDRARCGVADYARFLGRALESHFDLVPIAFPETERRSAWIRAAAAADSTALVHVHYEYSLFRTVKPYRNRFATFMKRLQPPSVVTLHDLLPQLGVKAWGTRWFQPRSLVRELAYAPWFGSWRQEMYGLADHWLVHSEEHRRVVATVVGASAVSSHLHPIPETGCQWSEPPPSPKLVSPGFVKHHKGYLEFLDVLERLPSATWVIAGGPQDERDVRFVDELETRAARSGVADRLEITGYLDRAELERLASTATMAVFPFERVTGSGSLTWAIGLGMPVVASDLLPFRELAEAGAGLELLPLHQRDTWADRISALLVSPDRLAALGSANDRYRRSHGYDQLAGRLRDLFARLSNPRLDRTDQQ